MELFSLGNGIEGLYIENRRFNTTVVSFNFYMPLKFETISENALLIYILSSCSKEYDSFRKLNTALSLLYGASLNVSVNRAGDNQLIKLSVSVIDDEYTLCGESVVLKAVNLLQSLIFEPRIADNLFFPDDIERERRKINEHILAEINDKRKFAHNRLYEEMFKGKPYGIRPYGTTESVNKVTAEDLYNAWLRLLKTAHIRVNVVSKKLPEDIFESISGNFAAIKREPYTDYANCEILLPAKEVGYYKDTFQVAQGKLVMGFSSETFGAEAYDLYIAADIFGGGPYSKLFENVREKMSLCYYCSALPVMNKGFLFVSSGVEKDNAEKAKTAILEQLESVKAGDFSDFTFEASIKNTICDLQSANDSLAGLDNWYASRIFTDEIKSPEEIIELIKKITREDVIKAANGIKLHTVYELMPIENGGADNAD